MTRTTSWMAALALLAGVGVGLAAAQGGQDTPAAANAPGAREQAAQRQAPLPPDTRQPHVAFRAECGACHIPYPPRFLPKASWRAMMANLSDHFGEDASLADDTAAKIEKFLVEHAARWRVHKDATPPLRISKLRWFVHEHREEVSPRSLKKAGSWSNCGACHRGAARGYFDDD